MMLTVSVVRIQGDAKLEIRNSKFDVGASFEFPVSSYVHASSSPAMAAAR
jgi:hypothetical protein